MSAFVPVRLQLRRVKGFDLQRYSWERNGLPATHCARPGTFGNPFVLDDAERATWMFREALVESGSYLNLKGSMRVDQQFVRARLRGRNLACFCKEQARFCHVDVLLEVANA